MNLGTENRKQTIAAAVLGVLLLLVIAYEFWPSSSTIASTTTATADLPQPSSSGNAAGNARPVPHSGSRATSAKKGRAPQSLDPTLHLDQLAATEHIKYEGSGRNIFVAQGEEIPKLLAPGQTDKKKDPTWVAPPVAAPPPIPLKFFGFASQPGEPKKVFLSNKGDDIFIAGEGEIVDRRYKVVKISPTSVEIQDVVSSGPAQNIPLTQGNPS